MERRNGNTALTPQFEAANLATHHHVVDIRATHVERRRRFIYREEHLDRSGILHCLHHGRVPFSCRLRAEQLGRRRQLVDFGEVVSEDLLNAAFLVGFRLERIEMEDEEISHRGDRPQF